MGASSCSGVCDVGAQPSPSPCQWTTCHITPAGSSAVRRGARGGLPTATRGWLSHSAPCRGASHWLQSMFIRSAFHALIFSGGRFRSGGRLDMDLLVAPPLVDLSGIRDDLDPRADPCASGSRLKDGSALVLTLRSGPDRLRSSLFISRKSIFPEPSLSNESKTSDASWRVMS